MGSRIVGVVGLMKARGEIALSTLCRIATSNGSDRTLLQRGIVQMGGGVVSNSHEKTTQSHLRSSVASRTMPESVRILLHASTSRAPSVDAASGLRRRVSEGSSPKHSL